MKNYFFGVLHKPYFWLLLLILHFFFGKSLFKILLKIPFYTPDILIINKLLVIVLFVAGFSFYALPIFYIYYFFYFLKLKRRGGSFVFPNSQTQITGESLPNSQRESTTYLHTFLKILMWVMILSVVIPIVYAFWIFFYIFLGGRV